MKNKKFCIANWKMYMNKEMTLSFLDKFNSYNFRNNNFKKIVICPSFPYLHLVSSNIKNECFTLGSQDVSDNIHGAFTSEISIEMIEDNNCSYIIIGHSERRENFNENDLTINKKLNIINNSEITPIVCVGEKLIDRENDNAYNIVENQILKIFSTIEVDIKKDLIIAYEPVWAIGTGKSASIEDIKDMHLHIKNIINKIYKNHCNIYLLYGGSVNDSNSSEIASINNVDGFLIGSSSIDPEKFYNIYDKL